MKKRSLFTGILAIAALGSLLAGCSQKTTEAPASSAPVSAESAGEPAAEPSADHPEALVWNMGNEPKTWDPTLSSETLSEYITISMFEGLTRCV